MDRHRLSPELYGLLGNCLQGLRWLHGHRCLLPIHKSCFLAASGIGLSQGQDARIQIELISVSSELADLAEKKTKFREARASRLLTPLSRALFMLQLEDVTKSNRAKLKKCYHHQVSSYDVGLILIADVVEEPWPPKTAQAPHACTLVRIGEWAQGGFVAAEG